MQFQPYKGGGGPDFLSLALNLRQQRNREESQKRRDEADLIRAQTAAMTAAAAEKRANAKEERDAREFALKELGLRRDALNAIRPDFIATQEAVGQQMSEAAQQFQKETTDIDREVIAGESEFARIVNEADPSFVPQRLQPLREAAAAGQDAMAPLYEQLGQIEATSVDIRNRERGRRLQADEEFLQATLAICGRWRLSGESVTRRLQS